MPQQLQANSPGAAGAGLAEGFDWIEVDGPDAVDYLQSQLTSDLTASPLDQLVPSAWCSASGRVEVVMLTVRRQDQVVIVLPADRVDDALRRLNLYRIGRKIRIGARQSARLVRFHSGFQAGSGAIPLAMDASRGVVFADEPVLPGNTADCSLNEWLWADVGIGMPWIVSPNQDAYLPQMLDLERIGALSYRKGCFPGQEVIARVHYRGRVTRRLAAFELARDRCMAPGESVSVDGQPGKVLYAAKSPSEPDRRVRGLAVLPAEHGTDKDPDADAPDARMIDIRAPVLLSDA